MLSPKSISRKLAEIIADGVWTEEEIERRVRKFLGERRKWVVRFAAQLCGEFAARRSNKGEIERFLRSDSDFRKALKQNRWKIKPIAQSKPVMRPVAGPPTTWNIQPILHRGELADWLGLNVAELKHLADRSYRERHFQAERQKNYRYHWLAKRSGNACRLIEVPKQKLKQAQRQILYEILDGIPAHPAAHGFCQGRSTVSCVAPHVGREAVLRMDLRDFFPTVRPVRVLAIFRTVGYPEEVGRLLTALCTNVASIDVWDQYPPRDSIREEWRDRGLYDTAHLPQGAPTSPALGTSSPIDSTYGSTNSQNGSAFNTLVTPTT
jgi:RNA-directed DNA polymerase